MACSLPPYPTFDYASDKSNTGPRWERWVSRLENLFVGLKIENDDCKRALLLHYAGEGVYDIYDAEKGETEATYTATKQVLTTYFEPKKNTQMEVYQFRSYKQKEGQSLDEFVTELRKLAKTCEFTNMGNEILSQVIQNCKSNRLRRRALREPDKTLNDILTLGRTLEMADAHATEMKRESVNIVTNVNKQNQIPNRRKGNIYKYETILSAQEGQHNAETVVDITRTKMNLVKPVAKPVTHVTNKITLSKYVAAYKLSTQVNRLQNNNTLTKFKLNRPKERHFKSQIVQMKSTHTA